MLADMSAEVDPRRARLVEEPSAAAGANSQLVRRVFDELAEGNIRPLVDAMADDFSWTVSGTSRWSRSYRGKRSVLEDLLGAVGAQFVDRYTVTASRILAAGDFVVVECDSDATTRAGNRYGNAYCWIIRLAEGRLQELVEYGDTRLIDEVLDGPTC